jgi:hypothetical protein
MNMAFCFKAEMVRCTAAATNADQSALRFGSGGVSIDDKTKEAAMKRSTAFAMAKPLLLGVGLVLSACATAPGYGASAYSYDDPYGYADYSNDPIYGALDFGFGGSDFHHVGDFGHGHGGHDFGQHGGHGIAGFGGHGFAGRGGFGGHGGGGHGGGGHGRG